MEAGVIVAIVLSSVAIFLVLFFVLYSKGRSSKLKAESSGAQYSTAYQKAYATASRMNM